MKGGGRALGKISHDSWAGGARQLRSGHPLSRRSAFVHPPESTRLFLSGHQIQCGYPGSDFSFWEPHSCPPTKGPAQKSSVLEPQPGQPGALGS